MKLSISDIEQKVIEVLAEKSFVDANTINLDSSLVDDLGMDSLDATEAIFQFEEDYGIEVNDEDMMQMKKVRDLVDYISKLLKSMPTDE